MPNPEVCDTKFSSFLSVRGVEPIRTEAILRRDGTCQVVREYILSNEFLELQQEFYGVEPSFVKVQELLRAYSGMMMDVRRLIAEKTAQQHK